MITIARMSSAADSEFTRPDYTGGGLINLMSTLATASGATMPYPHLAPAFGLAADELATAKHIVLIVIDGLGDALINEQSAPNLAAHRIGRITSVFPSTTASAVTTLLTGLAPAQHGLTGWHMWFAEIDRILAVLPLVPRGPRVPGWDRRSLPPTLFAHHGLAEQVTRHHLTLSPRSIAGSPFNAFHCRGSTCLPYDAPAEFFPLLAATLTAGSDLPSYVHAYLPDLDELMHEVGPAAPATGALLKDIDAAFGEFLQFIAGTGTHVVLTADHGFIDAPEAHAIDLEQHPMLAAMLERPLCGERRVAFAYVRKGCQTAFEAYVARHLADACRLIPVSDFIAAGWFGPVDGRTPAAPQLQSRAGDYVLLMRADWTIKDWMPGEPRYAQKGVHGGASAAEMWVPLIVART